MHKTIHQPHDKFIKKALSDIRVARDYFIAHMPKSLLRQIDLSTLSQQKQSFINPRYRATEADIIYKASLKESDILLYSLIEHQTEPDRWIPLRIAGYELAMLEDYRKQHPNKPLPVIYSFIIYTGEAPYTYLSINLIKEVLTLY